MSLTVDQLKRSLHLTETIEKLKNELNSIYASISNTIAPEPVAKKPKKRKTSAAARANMAAAQKARRAKAKGGADVRNPHTKAAKDTGKHKKKGTPFEAAVEKSAKPIKKKRTMSVASKARIAAAQKARWAKVKAAKGTK